MAVIPFPSLDSSDLANWLFLVNGINHIVEVPASNCRPAKEVVDASISNYTRQCVTTDTCAPFLKPYNSFGYGVSLYETVPGIGIGCLIIQGTSSVTHRSSAAPTDAGSWVEAKDALGAIGITADSFVTLSGGGAVAGSFVPPNTNKFFGAASKHGKICPR